MEKKRGRKPKFRPRITRIKLNPEQSVLMCDCYLSGSKLVYGVADLSGGLTTSACWLSGDSGKAYAWAYDIKIADSPAGHPLGNPGSVSS